MKKALSILAASAALLLASCDGGNLPTTGSDTGSSDEVVDVESSGTDVDTTGSGTAVSGDSESSNVDTPVTGDSESSNVDTPVAEGGYTADELEAIQFILGDHDIPYYDYGDLTTDVSADYYQGYFYLYVEAYEADVALRDAVIAAHEAEGWFDVSAYYELDEGEYALEKEYDDGTVIDVIIYLSDTDYYTITSGTGILNRDYYDVYIVEESLPEVKLETMLEGLLDVTGVEIPAASTNATGYVATSYYYTPFLIIEGETGYDAILTAAGWTGADYDGETGYTDPTEQVVAFVSVDEGDTYVYFVTPSDLA